MKATGSASWKHFEPYVEPQPGNWVRYSSRSTFTIASVDPGRAAMPKGPSQGAIDRVSDGLVSIVIKINSLRELVCKICTRAFTFFSAPCSTSCFARAQSGPQDHRVLRRTVPREGLIAAEVGWTGDNNALRGALPT